MGSDQQVQAMLLQHLAANVGPKVAPAATEQVGLAAVYHLGVAPQDIQDLTPLREVNLVCQVVLLSCDFLCPVLQRRLQN